MDTPILAYKVYRVSQTQLIELNYSYTNNSELLHHAYR